MLLLFCFSLSLSSFGDASCYGSYYGESRGCPARSPKIVSVVTAIILLLTLFFIGALAVCTAATGVVVVVAAAAAAIIIFVVGVDIIIVHFRLVLWLKLLLVLYVFIVTTIFNKPHRDHQHYFHICFCSIFHNTVFIVLPVFAVLLAVSCSVLSIRTSKITD